jgi:hypothetical protein
VAYSPGMSSPAARWVAAAEGAEGGEPARTGFDSDVRVVSGDR